MVIETLDRLGLPRLPPLIAEPEDSYSEDHRRNCLAWHLLANKSRGEIEGWLKRQSRHMRQDMRVRLNQLKEQVHELRQEVARQ